MTGIVIIPGMLWEILGAHRDDGREVKAFIEAENEDSAKRRANRRGILVSGAKIAERQESPEDSVNGMQISSPIPDYDDILDGDKMLRLCASIIFVVGGVAMAIGLFGVVDGIISSRNGDSLRGSLALSGGAVCLFIAVPFLIASVMLRMYASLGIAIRDMAQNSFRPVNKI